MKNLMKMAGIIALTAVIGFSIVACSGGGGGINGTWIHDDSSAFETVYNNGKWTTYVNGEQFMQGTYTLKGNEITLNFTEKDDDEIVMSGSGTFSVKGNKLTITTDGKPTNYTKK